MRRIDRIKLLVFWGLLSCVAVHILQQNALSPAPAQSERRVLLKPDAFHEMMKPETVAGAGFRLPGWIIWGGSTIQDDAGRYHLFVSRWNATLGHNAWGTSSEIAHAVSDSLLGPWTFYDVALPRRGRHFWDGMATHNPNIHYHRQRNEYVLFYIGMTYDFEPPFNESVQFGKKESNRSLYERAWNSKRVGVASSKSLYGPWRRLNSPIIHPRPGHWDGAITSNPTATFLQDGSTILFYKSISVGYPVRDTLEPPPVFHIGGAIAESPLGPYRRIQEEPILAFNGVEIAAEDPFLWYCPLSGRLHLIFKSMNTLRKRHLYPVTCAPDIKRNPQACSTLVVPGGWLAYTYTAWGGNTSTWSKPQVAFNRTLTVLEDDKALGEDGGGKQATSWRQPSELLRGLRRRPSLVLGLPAVTNQRRFVLDAIVKSRGEKGAAAAALPVADNFGRLTVDRLERPQLFFDASGTPTHLFAAMMINGSSANVALRMAPRPNGTRWGLPRFYLPKVFSRMLARTRRISVGSI